LNFELTFEQLQGKLKKVLDPSRFRFILILYPNTNMIDEIKSYISNTYPESLVTNLDLQNKSYQDISTELYKNNEGFVYINDFEELLDNPELYNGFNQRRDKIASHNINLICFISLYQKEELFTKSLNVIPDLWEFKDTVLELQKDEKTNQLIDINVTDSMSYSSIGGTNTKDKKVKLENLLKELDEVNNDELRLNILKQVAMIYDDLGESKLSLEYYLKELELKEKLNASEDQLAVSYNNIALAYKDLGYIDEALKYQFKTLHIRENSLTKNDIDLALSYSNLSIIYEGNNDLEKALNYQIKSLEIREKNLEENHPDLANSYGILAMIYQGMGKLEQAIQYQKKDLKILEKVLGNKHPSLARSYSNISAIYHDIGELEKALVYQLKALHIREEILGEVHPDVANSYNNISLLYRDKKECTKAKEFLYKGINILKQLNFNHPHLITCTDNLKQIESQIKKQKNAGYKKKGKYCKDM
jgi:tetratricopeptide (TPR) repeat protein